MVLYFWFVVSVAAGALVAFSMPDLLLGMTFTFVLIPVSLLLMACLSLSVFLVPTAILQVVVFPWFRRTRRIYDTLGGFSLALGIVALLNVAIALPIQRRDVADLKSLAEADVISSEKPEIGGKVGIVADGDIYGLGILNCPDLCQRLLLTGVADEVVLSHADHNPEVPDPDRYATIWRMERRAVCPDVPLNTNGPTMRLPGEPELGQGVPKPVDLMYREIAVGNCLIQTNGTYGRPDFTMLNVNVRKGAASGRRVALVRHGADGDSIVFRQTGAQAEVMSVPMLPTVEFPGMRGERRFLRVLKTMNRQGRYDAAPDFDQVVSLLLGDDLAVVRPETRDGLRNEVDGILARSGDLPDSARTLIVSYIESFDFRGMSDPADQAMMLRIVRDARTALPWRAGSVLPELTPETAAFFNAMADAAFARISLPLAETRLQRGTAEGIGGLFEFLPADEIKLRSNEMIRLVRDPVIRNIDTRIVRRLADVGRDAGPLLVDLLREPPPDETAAPGKLWYETWKDQRISALVALCRGGSEFAGEKSAIEALLSEKRDGERVLPLFHLSIAALARIGFTQEELASQINPSDESQLRDLEAGFRRAGRSPEPDCGW